MDKDMHIRGSAAGNIGLTATEVVRQARQQFEPRPEAAHESIGSDIDGLHATIDAFAKDFYALASRLAPVMRGPVPGGMEKSAPTPAQRSPLSGGINDASSRLGYLYADLNAVLQGLDL
jgi:hypothetical protein